MKSIMVIILMVASSVHAARIHSAKYDAQSDAVVVDLTYGGCNIETFKLTYGPCMETFPMQVKATLDDSQDVCRAIIRTSVALDLNGLICRPAHMGLSTRSGEVVHLFIPEKAAASEQSLDLPLTMDAGSVQAVLKNLLFERLEAQRNERPSEGGFLPYQVKLSGTYSNVVLEDNNAKLECREHPAGMMAVQQFGCTISQKQIAPSFPNNLTLPLTTDAASVQSFVKELLYAKLEKEGPQTAPYQANLTGSYSRVVLEDEKSYVSCTEHPAGMLAVQQFQCTFGVK